jgi:hypothetical protein
MSAPASHFAPNFTVTWSEYGESSGLDNLWSSRRIGVSDAGARVVQRKMANLDGTAGPLRRHEGFDEAKVQAL